MNNLLGILSYYRISTKLKHDLSKKEVIILGMHRSGTSLVSGLLAKLGVSVGKDFDGPTPSNPVSHFEDIEFRKLNDKILKYSGGYWDQPPKELEILKNKKKFSKAIERLVIKKSRRRIWGWKDPRTVITIENYMQFLKNPYFIIVFRNPLSIALSLNNRKSRPIESGLKLSSVYNQRIVNFLKKYPNTKKILINYEDLILDPVSELRKIIEFIQIKPTLKEYISAYKLINKKFKRF